MQGELGLWEDLPCVVVDYYSWEDNIHGEKTDPDDELDLGWPGGPDSVDIYCDCNPLSSPYLRRASRVAQGLLVMESILR